MWMYAWMNVYACMNVCMYACMDVWMYGWMYACMNVWRFKISHFRRDMLFRMQIFWVREAECGRDWSSTLCALWADLLYLLFQVGTGSYSMIGESSPLIDLTGSNGLQVSGISWLASNVSLRFILLAVTGSSQSDQFLWRNLLNPGFTKNSETCFPSNLLRVLVRDIYLQETVFIDEVCWFLPLVSYVPQI